MSNKVFILCMPIVVLLLAVRYGIQNTSDKTDRIVIGITQINQHSSLDMEREGIIMALSEAGFHDGKNVKIIYQNAQGSTSLASQIIRTFIASHAKVIVAISTPSAQSALPLTKAAGIPLVFTAVSDPLAANLIETQNQPTAFATGVTDALSAESQLELIARLLPRLRKLGVIYNSEEMNSVKTVDTLSIRANQMGITVVPEVALKGSEVRIAAEKLVDRAEAIYIPNDNTTAAAIESVVNIGTQFRIPVFAGDPGSITRGAIAMVGYNRNHLGKLAGERVVRVLRGENPDKISIAHSHPLEILVNPKNIQKMNVKLPSPLPEVTRILSEAI